MFKYGARFSNHMIVSDAPVDWNFARWRNVLENYQIDGKRVLDQSAPSAQSAIARLMSLEQELDGTKETPNRTIEPCQGVLARTRPLVPITDDNMGTEWRYIWGLS